MLFRSVVAVLTQQDQNRVASSCLAVPRLLLAASAISSITIGALLAFGDGHVGGIPIWNVLTWFTFFIALRFTVGFIIHSYRINLVRKRSMATIWNVRDDEDAEQLSLIQYCWKRGVPDPSHIAPLALSGNSAGMSVFEKLGLAAVRRRRRLRARRIPEVTDVEQEIQDNSEIAEALWPNIELEAVEVSSTYSTRVQNRDDLVNQISEYILLILDARDQLLASNSRQTQVDESFVTSVLNAVATIQDYTESLLPRIAPANEVMRDSGEMLRDRPREASVHDHAESVDRDSKILDDSLNSVMNELKNVSETISFSN